MSDNDIIPRASKFFNYIDEIIMFEGGVNYDIMSLDRGGLTNFGARYDMFKDHLRRYAYHRFYLTEDWELFHSVDAKGNLFLDHKKYKKKHHIEFLTPNKVRFFYYKDYWEPIQADKMPFGIDFFTFDFTVNSGQGNSIEKLQEMVGTIQDGGVGPKTLKAIDIFIDTHGLVEVEEKVEIEGVEHIVVNKYISRKLGIEKLLSRYEKRRREFLSGTHAGRTWPRSMDNRVSQAYQYALGIIGSLYIDDRKPLALSNTISAVNKASKAGVVIAAVGTVSQQAELGEKSIDALPYIVENLETIDFLTKTINSIMSYGWLTPTIILILVCGYINRERVMKFFVRGT